MPKEFDYKDHATQLSETLVDMVTHLIQKHNQNILEEMHAQIKKKNAEIAKLKAIVGSFTMLGNRGIDLALDATNSICGAENTLKICGVSKEKDGMWYFYDRNGDRLAEFGRWGTEAEAMKILSMLKSGEPT